MRATPVKDIEPTAILDCEPDRDPDRDPDPDPDPDRDPDPDPDRDRDPDRDPDIDRDRDPDPDPDDNALSASGSSGREAPRGAAATVLRSLTRADPGHR